MWVRWPIATSLPLLSLIESVPSLILPLIWLLLRTNHWRTLCSVRPVCCAICIIRVSFGKQPLANASFSNDRVEFDEQFFVSPSVVGACTNTITHKCISTTLCFIMVIYIYMYMKMCTFNTNTIAILNHPARWNARMIVRPERLFWTNHFRSRSNYASFEKYLFGLCNATLEIGQAKLRRKITTQD